MTTAPENKPPKKKRKRIKKLTPQQREAVMFPVLMRFLKEMPVVQIAKEVTKEEILKGSGIVVSRERVYSLVSEAVQRKYLVLTPPIDKVLTDALASFPNRGDVHVVPAGGDHAHELVSAAGAKLTYDLIMELARQRGGKDSTVHIAFGIGRTTVEVVRNLVPLLRADLDAPRLVVHASSPSFFLWHPLDTPLSAFGELFHAMKKKSESAEKKKRKKSESVEEKNDERVEKKKSERIEFVNLEVPPFAPVAEYGRLVRQKPIKAAYERAAEIDIVITSFADKADKHGYLREYLTRFEIGGVDELDAAGWVGDIHMNPYSATGPVLIEDGYRPVTLFQLSDLVALANKKDKHVVLLCAPCTYCGELKDDALLPLMCKPELRAWNHLVVDYLTAFEVNAARMDGRATGAAPTARSA